MAFTLNPRKSVVFRNSVSRLHESSPDPYGNLLQKLADNSDSVQVENLRKAVEPITYTQVPETPTPPSVVVELTSQDPSSVAILPDTTIIDTSSIAPNPSTVLDSFPPVTQVPNSAASISFINDVVNTAQVSVEGLKDISKEVSSSLKSMVPSEIPNIIPPSLSLYGDAANLVPKSTISTLEYPSIDTHGLLLRAIQSFSHDAMEAAQRATMVASDLTAPTKTSFEHYIATKAAIASSVKLSSTERVPTLVEYFQSGQAAQEYESLLESLRYSIVHLREEVFNQQQILLHFIQERKEDMSVLGPSSATPWYAAAFLLIFSFWQRKEGERESRMYYEQEMMEAREKAEAAAEAARIAADGARKALDLVNLLPTLPSTPEVKQEMSLLETTKTRQLDIERELMQDELKRLRQETAELRATIETIRSLESKVSTRSSPVSSVIVKERMIRDPEEDVRILDVIKAIDDDNAMKKQAAKEEMERKAREEEAMKKRILEEEVARMREAKEAARKAEEELVKVMAAKRAADEEALAAKRRAEMKAAAVKAAKEALTKKVEEKSLTASKNVLGAVQIVKNLAMETDEKAMALKGMVGDEKTLETKLSEAVIKKEMSAKKRKVVAESLSANEVADETNAKKSVGKSTKRLEMESSTSKTLTPVNPVIEIRQPINSWAAMKESTLMRKTIAELKEYLSVRVSISKHLVADFG